MKTNKIFDLMEKQIEFAILASQEILEMIQDGDFKRHQEIISNIESSADILVHTISDIVDKTFITPIDKEDINILCSTLDDIVDRIESASARINIYNLKKEESTEFENMMEICSKLVNICTVTGKAIGFLNNNKKENIMENLILIHDIENGCDVSYRNSLKRLWESNVDCKYLIAWKDIYSRIESATDACEDVSKILERIRIKYYA